MKYKILDYARIKCRAKRTIRDWIAKGKVKSVKEGKQIWIIDDVEKPNVAIYARVNSYGNSNKLDEQIKRITDYCNDKDYNIVKVVKEVGYNTDDDRSKLSNLLIDNKIDIIVVENKDTLLKFGFNYINKLLSINNRKIEFIEEKETNKEELFDDFSNMLSKYSSELFNKPLKISIKEKKEDDTDGKTCG